MAPAIKFTYPCEPIDTQELYKKVHSFRDFGDIRRFLHVVSVQDLDWTRIQHLAIYNITNKGSAKKTKHAGFSAGGYVSQDGKLLLIMLPHGSIPEDFLNHYAPCLQTLSIEGCNTLTSLPGLGKFTQLVELKLSGCSSLTELPELEKLTQLTTLDLSRCNSLNELPGLENLTQLTALDLSNCNNLTALPGLENLTQLTVLDLSRCDKLVELPWLENLTQLTALNLSRCSNLMITTAGTYFGAGIDTSGFDTFGTAVANYSTTILVGSFTEPVTVLAQQAITSNRQSTSKVGGGDFSPKGSGFIPTYAFSMV